MPADISASAAKSTREIIDADRAGYWFLTTALMFGVLAAAIGGTRAADTCPRLGGFLITMAVVGAAWVSYLHYWRGEMEVGAAYGPRVPPREVQRGPKEPEEGNMLVALMAAGACDWLAWKIAIEAKTAAPFTSGVAETLATLGLLAIGTYAGALLFERIDLRKPAAAPKRD